MWCMQISHCRRLSLEGTLVDSGWVGAVKSADASYEA